MTQLDDIAFFLLAAGGGMETDSEGHLCSFYLYVEESSLVMKPWIKDEEFGPVDTIAESVRSNSTAPYIIAPSTRLIAYVSSSDQLSVCELDEDSDQWINDKTVPRNEVHPNGQVAAGFIPGGRVSVIFQDPSKQFILLNRVGGSWTSTILPANPTVGSPIGTWVVGNRLHLFYVSDTDNCLHLLVEDGSSWKDEAVASCVFDEDSKPKRFLIVPVDDGSFEVMVMAENNTVWKFKQSTGDLVKVGHMEGNKFEPDDSAQFFAIIFFAPIFIYGPMICTIQ